MIALGVLAFLAIAAAGAFWWGWLIMLLMGVLHNEVSAGIPAIGFWPSVAIGFLLSLIIGGVKASSK